MSLKIFFQASRPKTLMASLFPATTGVLLAYMHGFFNLSVAVSTVLCAICLQILTNLANDYYDFKKGADNSERLGPQRVMASGKLLPTQMRQAILINVFLCFLLGVYLVLEGGLPILIIGISSIVFAIAYTAGPFPLAYLGLGEIFSFIFFGVVATLGSYYLQTKAIHISALAAGSLFGFLSVALICANNLRDEVSDTIANKKTIIVRFGSTFGKAVFISSVFSSLFFLVIYILAGYLPWTIAIGFTLIKFATDLIQKMKFARPEDVIQIFPLIAKYYLLYGLLFNIALIISIIW